ncbi:tRNA-splicing endonuclease subunit [Coemansia sp. RSA 2618]|nr:tRNA-splicing endonuclease subunit [Coemansia sp. RSA 2618]
MDIPKLRCVNGQVLVTSVDVVLSLRKEHRVVGSLEGSHPANPLQNHYFGLPLMLFPEETALLLERHAVELEGDAFTWPETEEEHIRFRLFKDLHSRGYFITRGIKYGGDYLLYPGKLSINFMCSNIN